MMLEKREKKPKSFLLFGVLKGRQDMNWPDLGVMLLIFILGIKA